MRPDGGVKAKAASTRILDVYEASLNAVDEILGVPKNEWTPKLGYNLEAVVGDARSETFRSRWPPDGGASYARETTELSALATKVRGSRRAEARSRLRAARLGDAAAGVRRRQAAQHGRWLLSTGPRTIDRAVLLGCATTAAMAPGGETVFRRARIRRSAQPSTCGQFAVLMGRGEDRTIEEAAQREYLRFEARVACVAATLKLLGDRQNRRPGHGRILELNRALHSVARENADPAGISRAQFVHVARATLTGFSDRAANALYSAFDPGRTDSVRCGAVACALLAAHRPEAHALELSEDQAREKSAALRGLAPFVRRAVEAYDVVEGGGLDVAQVQELFTTFATSRGDLETMLHLLEGAQSRMRARMALSDVMALLRESPELLGELERQVGEFRAAVRRRAS